MSSSDVESRRAASRKYRKTQKGKATESKYKKSKKGKLTDRRYYLKKKCNKVSILFIKKERKDPWFGVMYTDI